MAGAAKGQPPGQEAAAAHWPGTSPVPGASLGAAWAGKGSAPRFSLPPPLSHRQPEQSGRQASQLPFTLPQARTQAPRELTAQLQSEPAGRQPGPGVALGCFLETPTSSGPGRQLCTKEAGNKTETPPPPQLPVPELTPETEGRNRAWSVLPSSAGRPWSPPSPAAPPRQHQCTLLIYS